MKRNFANHRGLIRTVMADLMWRLGPYRKYGRVDWQKVKRLVFVCQGNICRSPFAHYVAMKSDFGLPVDSFGLATTTGSNANSTAIEVAGDYGVDMTGHRVTDMSDFIVLPGDLLLVMEDRHIGWLHRELELPDAQICLLGLWCRPRFALLYDPHTHPRDYFSVCFSRIERAIQQLKQDYRRAGNI